jgi:hypothetical protein
LTRDTVVLVAQNVQQARATAVGIMQEIGCEVFDAYNARQALDILHVDLDHTA